MNRPVLLLSSAMVLLSCAPSDLPDNQYLEESAVTDAPIATNPNIPPGKVTTPFGLADAECVHAVPSGAEIDRDGVVTLNGRFIKKIDRCPTAAPPVQPKEPNSMQSLPFTQGWIEWSNANAIAINGMQIYNFLGAYWTVPNAVLPYSGFPPVNNDSNLYLFSSFQSPTEIIQPVLQSGNNGHFGDRRWWIASWWVSGGSFAYSTPYVVNPGSVVHGTIQIVSNNPLTYTISASSGSVVTTLTKAVTGPFNTVQGGVFEAYFLYYCWELPVNTSTVVFSPIYVDQAGPNYNSFNSVTPAWTTGVAGGVNPNCGYSVSTTSGSTTLHL